ncbi:MAG: leucine-rich repeat protein, partial [Bacteroides sp.]|nr:leucine-rich repeat protein [Bacteroides sp.]
TKTSEIIPDQEGFYTIPALNGDVKVLINGKTQIHVEEGAAVSSEDLAKVDDDEAAEMTELAITGDLTEETLETLHEKFTSVETLDLSSMESETIPENAFAGMENLSSVILPPTVYDIGSGAFKGCENLTSLVLPNVVVIGDSAFNGCNSLTSLLMPAVGTNSSPTGAPARVKAKVARGTAVTEGSFVGLNPNCLIYVGGTAISGIEDRNIILTDDKQQIRKAASDIVLDGDYPFSVPAEFDLGEHRISFTIGVPGSIGTDEFSGWRGIILPFTPTNWEIVGDEYKYDNKRGSQPYFVSFDNEDSETLTEQKEFEANRPYLASVAAPFTFVPVTFYAEGTTVPITPMTDAITTKGKNFSLIGSFDGETTIGTCYELNENSDAFVSTGERKATVRPFGAYLLANGGSNIEKFEIGEHPLWIFDPIPGGVSGTKLYRNGKVELTSETNKAIPSARIYYTLDGSDPSDSKNSARREYAGGFNRTGDTMSVKAVTNYKNWMSDVVTLDFELKKVNATYGLANNWNWVSHNQDNVIPLSEFYSAGMTRVQSQTQEAVYDKNLSKMVGTLTEVEPAVTYKVYTEDSNSVYTVNGFAFNPTAPVQLRAGYNWIGCPIDDASLLIEDLFANLKAEDGDMLIGLEGYAEVETKANAEGKWYGTLQSLTTNGGYIYYSKSDKELVYNFAPVRDTEAQPAKVVSNAPWAVDIHKYASVMPVTACLVDEDGSKTDASEYAVGAFCGDECRGTGVYVNGVMMINVHGNPGDVISFRYITPENEEMLSVSELTFDENRLYSMNAPYAISLEGSTVAVETVSGSDFDVVIEEGSLSLDGDLSSVISLEVYDLAGNRVAAAAKGAASQLKVNELEPGVYVIIIRTADTYIYRKVMVK